MGRKGAGVDAVGEGMGVGREACIRQVKDSIRLECISSVLVYFCYCGIQFGCLEEGAE